MNTYVPNNKVLYVDDETNLLSSFSSLMWREPLKIHTLSDSSSIDTILAREGPFALVISDQRMPGLDGVGTLNHVRQLHPDTVRVLMTGYANMEDTQRAVNEATISRYISKPWDDNALKTIVHESVAQYNYAGENKHLTVQLADQNKMLTEMLEGTVGQSVRLLSHLISYINPHAANQTERVRKLGRIFLDMIPDVPVEERWAITRALDLFNLGIAVLPAWIQVTLNKEGLHSVERFPAAQGHHLLAAELLKDVPRFEMVAAIIRLQQKDYNGAGKPAAEIIKGKDIPLGARLLHILVDLDTQSTEHFHGREMLQQLMKRPLKYDTDLIAMMLGAKPSSSTPDHEESLSVDQLQEGMLVIADVATSDGRVLIRANSILNPTNIKILKQWNIIDHIPHPIVVRAAG